jgi:hypothetical protein
VRAEEVFFTEHKTGKAKLAPRSTRLNAVLARWVGRSSNSNNFVLPYLKAEAPYAQFPAGLTWAELSRLPEYRPIWLQLLPKIQSATVSINGNLKRVALLAGIDKNLTSTPRATALPTGAAARVARPLICAICSTTTAFWKYWS